MSYNKDQRPTADEIWSHLSQRDKDAIISEMMKNTEIDNRRSVTAAPNITLLRRAVSWSVTTDKSKVQ